MTPDLIAGRYHVLRPIGQGGMGTVWLCRDQVLGREVAVKKIGALPGESASDGARALREARSSAALNHRNVVSVFDVVDTGDGDAWLVMEYVRSRTLGEIVREDGPLRPRRAAWIGAQVANGLAAAHEVGTIHRDVKPGNILVGQDDVAKISDFGIARGANDEQLTRTGLVTGTPSYFSPELARGEDPGPESDVYALGATLYTAVEGHSPYPEQRNPIALLQKIAAEEPAPPVNAGPLSGPIARMMDRDPRSRWTMADAAQALRRVAEHGDAGHEETAVMSKAGAAGVAGAAGAGEARTGPAGGAGAAGGSDAVGARTRGDDEAAAPSSTPGPQPDRPGASRQADADDRGRRRSLTPWLVAAVVLLLAGLGGGFMLLGGDPDEKTTGASDTSSTQPSPRDSDTSSPSQSPSQSPTPTPTPTPKQSSSPRSQSSKPAPAGPAAMERDVADYFSLVPGNTDAGWQRLAPSMQADVGRADYDNWWGSIASVDLESADAVDGRRAVEIVLTYRFKDGSAKQERQRLTLQRSGSRYLIADDTVLSSRTVS